VLIARIEGYAIPLLDCSSDDIRHVEFQYPSLPCVTDAADVGTELVCNPSANLKLVATFSVALLGYRLKPTDLQLLQEIRISFGSVFPGYSPHQLSECSFYGTQMCCLQILGVEMHINGADFLTDGEQTPKQSADGENCAL
jgi:hypothetical protein